MVKVYNPEEYSQYKELPLYFLDPDDNLPKIETTTKKDPSISDTVEKFEAANKKDEEGFTTVNNKRRHSSGSPPKSKKIRHVSPQKLNDTIIGFVNGTITQADLVEEITMNEIIT